MTFSTPDASASVPLSAARTTATAVLDFAGLPIRYRMRGGLPWLAASDLARALQLDGDRSPGPWVRGLPQAERDHIEMATAAGPQRLTAVSVHGAIRLASRRNRLADQEVLSFLRRTVLPLIDPRAAHEEQAVGWRSYISTLRDLADRLERSNATIGAAAEAFVAEQLAALAGPAAPDPSTTASVLR